MPNNDGADMPRGARWWEAAGGVHSAVQCLYVLLGLALLFAGWCVRQEIRAATDADRFALVADRQSTAQQDLSEIRREVAQIRVDVSGLRDSQIRLETLLGGGRTDFWAKATRMQTTQDQELKAESDGKGRVQ